MDTYSTKQADIKRKWHVIDAKGKPLGRLSSEIACLLMGKHKAIYAPHLDTGDFVVVVNAATVLVTGTTRQQAGEKSYFRHSTYPGGAKTVDLAEMVKTHPTRVIEFAVKGMLPHNNLGRAMYRKLKVYPGASHPHQAQIEGKAQEAPATMEAAK